MTSPLQFSGIPYILSRSNVSTPYGTTSNSASSTTTPGEPDLDLFAEYASLNKHQRTLLEKVTEAVMQEIRRQEKLFRSTRDPSHDRHIGDKIVGSVFHRTSQSAVGMLALPKILGVLLLTTCCESHNNIKTLAELVCKMAQKNCVLQELHATEQLLATLGQRRYGLNPNLTTEAVRNSTMLITIDCLAGSAVVTTVKHMMQIIVPGNPMDLMARKIYSLWRKDTATHTKNQNELPRLDVPSFALVALNGIPKPTPIR
jgi:hypothetical protein